jgi:hypothetical protein
MDSWLVKVIGSTVVRSTREIALRRLIVADPVRPGWYRVDGYRFSRTGNPKSGRYDLEKLTEIESNLQKQIRAEGSSLSRGLDLLGKKPSEKTARQAKLMAFDAVYRWEGLLKMEPDLPAIEETRELVRWVSTLKEKVDALQVLEPELEEA